MKKTKKIISVLLSILMIITSVPLMAVESFAADPVKSGTTGECTWTLDGTVLTISGNGKMKDYRGDDASPWGTSITKVVIENGVTRIGSSAFKDCTSLTSVTIPDSVTYIGSYAFNGCTSLTSVNIPDSVTSIGGYTFSYCTSLTSVTIPDSVTSIGDYAFENCTSLTSITIPDNVTEIGYEAFVGCTSLTSITIPDSVTSIGDAAFYYCTSLTSITIPDSVTGIGPGAFENTAYYNNESNWENSLLYIGKHLIEAKKDVSGSVEIKQGTKTIVEWAFCGCTSLTSVTIPDSVTSIGDYAFSGCTSLTSVTIPNSVTSIGYQAFSVCTSLTSVTIPDSVTSIGNEAFADCTSLKRIDVVEGNQNYASVDGILYNKDKTILIYCPACCEAEAITIPDSVTEISDNAFWNCTSLTSVTIPDSVTSIGRYAFNGCTSLTNVTIGNGVISIGALAFNNCTSLTSINIPDSVTSIGDFAFEDCTSLTSVNIPDSVTSIGEHAFGYYYDSIENKHKTVDGFTIYGNRGSEAERYANKNGFKFVAIGDAPTMTFPDVRSGDWYNNAVKFNAEKGYITGYSNGTFGPSNNIQRQDFVLILARIAGADLSAYEGQNGGFSDVQAGAYYASAVAWAKDKGVVTGYSADNFGVGTYITREQISLILCRYLNGSASGNVDAILNAYSDGGNTSPWAKAGVAWAVENGIIGNSDYLNPNGNAGRAEVAQIIYNMSNKGML